MATHAAQLERNVCDNTISHEAQRRALDALILLRSEGNKAAYAALVRLSANKRIPIELAREAGRHL